MTRVQAAELAVVGLPFIALLGFEWRYRHKALRVVCVALAFVLLLFAQPNTHAAWRKAMGTPDAERLTQWPPAYPGEEARPMDEFVSGIFAMRDAVVKQARFFAVTRAVSLTALLWLALSPALRRVRSASSGEAADQHPTTR